jgi:RNA methyltransferase, TrmH family
MISKNKIKSIRSLEHKKNRQREGVFIAEGPKVVGDLLKIAEVKEILATKEWMEKNPLSERTTEVNEAELTKISFLQHPQQVVAVFKIPQHVTDISIINTSLCLALDGVQDPGNMGTIIRIADWFGIKDIFCSQDTTDAYNPKVIQATMGSIARVRIHYIPLKDVISSLPVNTLVFGTFLDGKNLYSEKLSDSGLIVMGNEGNGISKEIGKLINSRLLIPNFPPERETADSLNVAVATAIICSEFRRRTK